MPRANGVIDASSGQNNRCEPWRTKIPPRRYLRNRTTWTHWGPRLAAAPLLLLLIAVGPAAGQQEVDDYEAPSVPLSAFATQQANYKQESIDITLEPGEGMEYKCRLEPGGTLLFSWTSNALVHYELHSEPDGAPRGFSESYDKQDDWNEAHGSFAARFAGIHGWYWENRTEGEVTIKLTTAGFYSESLEFRSGMDVVRKQFP